MPRRLDGRFLPKSVFFDRIARHLPFFQVARKIHIVSAIICNWLPIPAAATAGGRGKAAAGAVLAVLLLGWLQPAAAQTGSQVYVNQGCGTCHGNTGQGIPGKGTNLRSSSVWQNGSKTEMIELLLFGKGQMDGYWGVASEQLANLLDYVDDTLNQRTRKSDFTTDEVQAVKDRGKTVYEKVAGINLFPCLTCHRGDGTGLADRPSLVNNSFLQTSNWYEIIREILGDSGHTPFRNLTTQQITDVINYVLANWNRNSDGRVPRRVTEAQADTMKNPATISSGESEDLREPTRFAAHRRYIIRLFLSKRPNSKNVTLTLSSHSNSVRAESNTALIFTRSNWNQEQTITFSVEDAVPAGELSVLHQLSVHQRDSSDFFYINTPALGINLGLTPGALRSGKIEWIIPANDIMHASNEYVVSVRLDHRPTRNNVTVTITSSDTLRIVANPATLVFSRSNHAVYQSATLRIKDTAPHGEVTDIRITAAIYNKNNDLRYQNTGPRITFVDIAFYPISFTADQTSRSIEENVGTAPTASGTPVGARIAATGGEVGQINNSTQTYSADPAHDLFSVSANGQIALKRPLNLNHEIQSSYTITVKTNVNVNNVYDNFAKATVIITVTDNPVEQPNTYTSYGLRVAEARNQITLSWNNDEYIVQFARADRGGLTIAYETGGGAATNVGLPADATSATITGLIANTAYTLSLGWKSSGTGISWSGRHTVTTSSNQPPAFAVGPLVRSLPENRGTTDTRAGITVMGGAVTADDPEGDAVTYSLEPEVGEFGMAGASGQITVKTPTNFNHEKKASYTITVKASDGQSFNDSATKEVVISIRNISERPTQYRPDLRGTSGIGSEIVLRWLNNDYIGEFDLEDRLSIVVSYGKTDGSGLGTLALGLPEIRQQLVNLTLRGLETNTSYDITLQWLSQDNLAYEGTPTAIRTSTADVGIIAGSIGSLGPGNRARSVFVRLRGAPTAKNVTLTMTSGDPADVGVDPATIVFTPDNWSEPQELVVRLSNAGANAQGNRAVAMRIAVHDPDNGDSGYTGVAAVEVRVPVRVSYPGEAVYKTRVVRTLSCELCHRGASLGPDLFNIVISKEEAIRAVLGLNPARGDSRAEVLISHAANAAAFASLTDTQIADVLIYIYNRFSSGGTVTEAQVAQVRAFGYFPLRASRQENTGEERTGANQVIATVTVQGNSTISGLTDPVSYSIGSGSDSGFVINSSSGVIRPASPIRFDADSKSSYTLSIVATDANSKTAIGQFVLSIDNIDEPPAFIAIANRAVASGNEMVITLHQPAEDPEGDAITYDISNKPPWLTGVPATTSGDVELTVGSAAVKGRYTLTVTAQDAGGLQAPEDATFTLAIIDPSGLLGWTVADGNIVVSLRNNICAYDFLTERAVSFKVEKLHSRDGIVPDVSDSDCGMPFSTSAIDGDLYGQNISSSVEIRAGEPIKWSFATPPSAFDFVFEIYEDIFNVERLNVGYISIDDNYRRFQLNYQVRAVAVTVSEKSASVGTPLATITLGNSIGGANWMVAATAEASVSVTPVVGREVSEAVVALAEETDLDYEASADRVFARLTILARSEQRADRLVSFQSAAETRLVVKLSNVNEPPFFADGVLIDREVGNITGGSFSVAATDPEGDDLVHTAGLASGGALPTGLTISVDGTFMVAPNTAIAEHVISVRAAERGNNDNYAYGQFTLNIAQLGGIGVEDAVALTPDSSAGTVSVQLLAPPAANVTLTITSGNPDHVGVDPATMVFTPGNWSDPQELVFELSEAGIGVEGLRTVAVAIAVHDPGSIDGEYAVVPAVGIEVEVNVPYAGEAVYISNNCNICHGPTGRGSTPLAPLSDNIANDQERAIRTILGLLGGTMATQRFFRLPDTDIANVLTYIYNSWGNSGGTVSVAQVAQVRAFGAFSLGASRPENIGDAETGVDQAIATVTVLASSISGLNTPVVYSIGSGSDSGFMIDSSGVIRPSSPINFDVDVEGSKSSYTLNIEAAGDKNSGMASGQFVLSITAVNEPPAFIAIANRAVAGSGRRITLHRPAEDPEGDAITYNIKNKPSWLTGTLPFTTSGNDVNVELTASNAAAKGQYTITVTAQDAGGRQAADATFTLAIIEPSGYLGWTVADGNIVVSLRNNICAYPFLAGREVFPYVDNANNSANDITPTAIGSDNCGTSFTEAGNLYGSDITSSMEVRAEEPIKWSFATPPALFSFLFNIDNDRIVVERGVQKDITFDTKFFILNYQVSDVIATVSEGRATVGMPLATITLARAIGGAGWLAAAAAEVSVSVTPVVGSETTEAVVKLAEDVTVPDYETNPDSVFVRLTILARERNQQADSQSATETRLVLRIGDVNEPPFFADGVLTDREVGNFTGGSFSVAATDPEGDVLVHTAGLASGGDWPTGLTISVDGTFMVAPNTAIAEHVISVRAAEDGNSANYVDGEFTLNIVQLGGISVGVVSRQPLTPDMPKATVPVRLLLAPEAGNIVTLTVTSAMTGGLDGEPGDAAF